MEYLETLTVAGRGLIVGGVIIAIAVLGIVLDHIFGEPIDPQEQDWRQRYPDDWE